MPTCESTSVPVLLEFSPIFKFLFTFSHPAFPVHGKLNNLWSVETFAAQQSNLYIIILPDYPPHIHSDWWNHWMMSCSVH